MTTKGTQIHFNQEIKIRIIWGQYASKEKSMRMYYICMMVKCASVTPLQLLCKVDEILYREKCRPTCLASQWNR